MAMVNNLAYYGTAAITTVKSFIVQKTVGNFIKL
jgi:hypothetical protein